MSNWYSVGHEEAEKMAASASPRRRKNFFTKAGESARIRFLESATKSFNYKRAFVKYAKGEKLLTSPGIPDDPFVKAGMKLQAAFAWPIVDRRIFEFTDDTGEDKKVGPRIMYFADGQRTRKQLIAFEKEMLSMRNEELEEEGKPPVTLEEYNLTSYDVKASKEKGSPWLFTAMRAKPLSDADVELVSNNEIDLMEELAPLPIAELNQLLNQGAPAESTGNGTQYSYSDDDDDTISFDN